MREESSALEGSASDLFSEYLRSRSQGDTGFPSLRAVSNSSQGSNANTYSRRKEQISRNPSDSNDTSLSSKASISCPVSVVHPLVSLKAQEQTLPSIVHSDSLPHRFRRIFNRKQAIPEEDSLKPEQLCTTAQHHREEEFSDFHSKSGSGSTRNLPLSAFSISSAAYRVQSAPRATQPHTHPFRPLSGDASKHHSHRPIGPLASLRAAPEAPSLSVEHQHGSLEATTMPPLTPRVPFFSIPQPMLSPQIHDPRSSPSNLNVAQEGDADDDEITLPLSVIGGGGGLSSEIVTGRSSDNDEDMAQRVDDAQDSKIMEEGFMEREREGVRVENTRSQGGQWLWQKKSTSKGKDLGVAVSNAEGHYATLASLRAALANTCPSDASGNW